jgi:subtilisin family serine protease
MATYVLIPRPGSATASEMSLNALEALAGPTGRRGALADLIGRLRARGTGGEIAVSEGVSSSTGLESTGVAEDSHSIELQQAGAPRALESVGAVIVDDLDEGQIEDLISEGIDVVPNFLIPIEEPVAMTTAGGPNFWHLNKVNAPTAWARGFRGAGVRIGILDTGIDVSHPEFAGRSISFMEFDDRGFKISGTPRDAGEHGTHVSALAAGNSCGIAPDARISVASVLTYPDAAGRLSGYFAQILAGANWLLQSNFATDGTIDEVDVMNASLGGAGYRPYLYSVLQLAQTVPATQLIASIGNSGPAMNSDGSPGNYDLTVGVGATDRNDGVANFSSWGTVSNHAGLAKPDLSAPGVDVWSARPGGGYQSMSGTSMASPIVTGAAALLIQKSPALRNNPATLRQLLLQHTVPVAPQNRIGRGRLDLGGI